jgi:hypothetical protein
MCTKLTIFGGVICTSAVTIAVLIFRHTQTHTSSVVLVADPEVVTVHSSGVENYSEEFTVRIKNVSPTAVSLAAIETSCSCTVVREGIPKQLDPHSEVDLRLKVTPPQYGEKLSVSVYRPVCGVEGERGG